MPAKTFSLTAWWRKPAGARTGISPRLDLLGRDDAPGAAEVVDVAVGVDQAGDRALAAVLAVEGQRRGGGLGGDQRVDHDDPSSPSTTCMFERSKPRSW